jgi:beta-galactosidase/beta-glucuronidase
MGNKALLWDEFSPNLYRLTCTISGKYIEDKREDMFGFRKLGTKGTEFTLNGKPLLLRGTLECAIFPKTGYPSVNENEWARIFKPCTNSSK